MPTKQFDMTANLPVAESGPANPGDRHLPIGRWDPATGVSYVGRVLLKGSMSFAGMVRINSARLYVYAHTAAGWHAHGSGNVTIEVRRKTSDWSEGSGGSTSEDEIWSGDYDGLVENNLADDGDSGTMSNGAADGALQSISVVNTVREWFGGKAPYGLVLLAPTDNASDAFEAYSRRQSGKTPYIEVDYDTNSPPTAPDNLSPAGGNTVQTGRTITYSGTRNDPDPGDGITAYQIQVRPTGGSTVQDYTSGNPGGLPATFSKALTLPAGSNADRDYEWRARTRDQEMEWGAWSPWRAFRPNSVPDTPSPPDVTTDSLTPTIGGSFSDPDPGGAGSTPANCQIEVEQVSPSTNVWSSGSLPIAASPWSKVYAGAPLVYGTAYRARIRVQDGLDGWSAWSSWTTFTPTSPVGPDNLSPRTTTTKQNSLTPTLTVGHSSTFRNDQVEVYAGSDLSSTKLWTKAWDGADYAAVNTKPRVYAGSALSWGAVYYWRAQIEDAAGVISAWSPLVPFRTNALPTAPTVTVQNDAGVPAVLSPAGVLVTTDTTPVLVAAFVDPDKATDGDTASARSIEIRRKDTGAALAGYPKTDALSTPHTVATALTSDVVYEARIGYRDNAGQPAGTYVYSAWRELKASAAPTVTLTAPAMDATVADSTPALDWAYASAPGKAQSGFRVQLFDRGPTAALWVDEVLVHDSGQVAGAATDYTVPPGIVQDGHSYRWSVGVADTDGQSAVLT